MREVLQHFREVLEGGRHLREVLRYLRKVLEDERHLREVLRHQMEDLWRMVALVGEWRHL